MNETKTPTKRLAANLAWKVRNKERVAEYERQRRVKISNTPELLEKKRMLNRKSARRNYSKRFAYDKARDPIKMHARAVVRQHVFDGRLERQPCKVCGIPNAQAHHEDYSKPLEVHWLCPKHHKEAHP